MITFIHVCRFLSIKIQFFDLHHWSPYFFFFFPCSVDKSFLGSLLPLLGVLYTRIHLLLLDFSWILWAVRSIYMIGTPASNWPIAVHPLHLWLTPLGYQRDIPHTLQDSCDSPVHLPIWIIHAWLICCCWQSVQQFQYLGHTIFLKEISMGWFMWLYDIFTVIFFTLLWWTFPLHLPHLWTYCFTISPSRVHIINYYLSFSDLHTFHCFEYSALHTYLHYFLVMDRIDGIMLMEGSFILYKIECTCSRLHAWTTHRHMIITWIEFFPMYKCLILWITRVESLWLFYLLHLIFFSNSLKSACITVGQKSI